MFASWFLLSVRQIFANAQTLISPRRLKFVELQNLAGMACVLYSEELEGENRAADIGYAAATRR